MKSLMGFFFIPIKCVTVQTSVDGSAARGGKPLLTSIVG